MYNQPIKIQIGKIFMNHTRKYLFPVIKKYGQEFSFKINELNKVAVGVGDIIVEKCGFHHEKHLFILVDSRIRPARFINTLEWLRKHDSFEDDYVYGNIQTSRFHMLVIRIPENFHDTLEQFMNGAYSKMYSELDIRLLFSPNGRTGYDRTLYQNITKVLLRDNNYRLEFAKQVKEEFDLPNYSANDLHPEAELDLPIAIIQEVFNYKRKEGVE